MDTLILDFAFSDKMKRLGAVLRDNSLCFWDEKYLSFEKILVSPLKQF